MSEIIAALTDPGLDDALKRSDELMQAVAYQIRLMIGFEKC